MIKRVWLARVVGVVSWLAILAALQIFAAELGVSTFIDLDEEVVVTHRHYEEEIGGYTTDIGIALHILAIMFAVRISMAISEGEINGGVSRKGNVDFFTWVVGIILFGMLDVIFFFSFKKVDSELLLTLLNVTKIAIIAGIFLLCKKWRNKKFQYIDKISKNEPE